MISEFAMIEIRARERAGITFSHEEVIRLNAIGLAVDHGEQSAKNYLLPRVAFLAGVTFREPTIAHELWVDEVCKWCDLRDSQTALLVKAYAYSRDAERLPKPFGKMRVRLAIEWFKRTRLTKCTFHQLINVMDYVTNGCAHEIGEYPEPLNKRPVDSELESIAVGVMRDCVAVDIGLSLDDIKRLTLSEAESAIERTLAMRGNGEDEKARLSRANADFSRTLDAICEQKKKDEEVK